MMTEKTLGQILDESLIIEKLKSITRKDWKL